jgi:hypothetical protein
MAVTETRARRAGARSGVRVGRKRHGHQGYSRRSPARSLSGTRDSSGLHRGLARRHTQAPGTPGARFYSTLLRVIEGMKTTGPRETLRRHVRTLIDREAIRVKEALPDRDRQHRREVLLGEQQRHSRNSPQNETLASTAPKTEERGTLRCRIRISCHEAVLRDSSRLLVTILTAI